MVSIIDPPRFFLYGSNDSAPVIDYHPDVRVIDDEPDFLFSSGQGPRIVEFYLHSCHHCQHFKDHYVQFAREIQTLTNGLVKCYGISCAAHTKICRKKNIHGYPMIMAISDSDLNQTTTKINYWELNTSIALSALGLPELGYSLVVDNITNNQQESKRENVPSFESKHSLRVNTIKTDNKKNPVEQQLNETIFWMEHQSKEELWNDIYLSFDYHIRTEIFTADDTELEEPHKMIFRSMLQLLQKTLPKFWHLQEVINAILNEFDTVTSLESKLLECLDKHPHPSIQSGNEWSMSCSHGYSGNGFTCGLWLLYHTMTIGVVEHNLIVADKGELISPAYAADTLNNYISAFFRCDECRYHFAKNYKECSFDRCHRLRPDSYSFSDSIELPIWLVRTHNEVTQRLQKERAEFPDQEQLSIYQWPSNTSCPHCWNVNKEINYVQTYSFLKSKYWPTHTKQISVLNSISIPRKDSTLFFIFVISTLLLMIMYVNNYRSRRYFLKKKRSINGKMKSFDIDL